MCNFLSLNIEVGSICMHYRQQEENILHSHTQIHRDITNAKSVCLCVWLTRLKSAHLANLLIFILHSLPFIPWPLSSIILSLPHPLFLSARSIVCARRFLSAAAFLSHFLLFDGLQHSYFAWNAFASRRITQQSKLIFYFPFTGFIRRIQSHRSLFFFCHIYGKSFHIIPLLVSFNSFLPRHILLQCDYLYIRVCVCFLEASNMLWPYWHSIEVHSENCLIPEYFSLK